MILNIRLLSLPAGVRAGLLASAMLVASGSMAQTERQLPLRPVGDSILISKKQLSRSQRFELYPDASGQAVFFNVRGTAGKVYQLYVFDLEGHLVRRSEIRSKQTSLISDMDKGIYLFEVFSDDDRIGSGEIAVL